MYSAEKEKESSEGNSELRPADAKRKLILEADDLTGAVERDVVYCKPCEKWIRLVGNIFNASNWLVHRSRRHTEIGNCNTTQYVPRCAIPLGNFDYNSLGPGTKNPQMEFRRLHIQRCTYAAKWKTADELLSLIICLVWSKRTESGVGNARNSLRFLGAPIDHITGNSTVTDFIRASTNHWKKEV